MNIGCWLAEALCDATQSFPGYVLVLHMAAMFYGYSIIFDVCCNASIWLSSTEAKELESARKMSLRNNAALTPIFSPHFPQKPKLHLCDQALRMAENGRLNPTAHWAFCDEDFIGQIQVLGALCHRNTVSLRLVQRYLVGLHIGIEDRMGQRVEQ